MSKPENSPGMTIGQILEIGEQQFENSGLYFGHGTTSAWDEAVYLVSHVLELPPEADRSLLNHGLTENQQHHIQQLFERRVNERIPAPYLTGQAWFCGLTFKVDSRVIIPRSPIAFMIMAYFEPWLTIEPRRILDLCTGSGCIGIACAYAFADAEVVLSDISPDALEVAQENIQAHALGDRVSAIQSDLFNQFEEQPFDLIVCNPPYVDKADFLSMPAEYHHEPELALASGDDGLDFTRRLLREASTYLSEKGILIVEVGNSSVALEKAFPDVPFLWLEFEEGDAGVFLLTKEQLLENRESFQ